MQQLLAKPVVEAVHLEVSDRVSRFKAKHGRAPGLAVVLVGDDPASVIYTTKKGQAAVAVGIHHETVEFSTQSSESEVIAAVRKLNLNPKIDGILVQRPIPKNFDAEASLYWVDPAKDVDCFHPINVGKLAAGLPGLRPCTPMGVMRILKHYGISVAGKTACVVGRSNIVGKPMAALLLEANATVLHCHSQTKDLMKLTRQAEILVVAAGKPGLVTADHVAKGAVVIDVGIHRNAAGKVCGDVDAAALAGIPSAITPVPGGVGPMTIAMLLANTVTAAEMRES
jgi:methylenetetrahydrofolate dehydrogenase (NADP+) / methenyltetrahydrofolate cyclohydrolase